MNIFIFTGHLLSVSVSAIHHYFAGQKLPKSTCKGGGDKIQLFSEFADPPYGCPIP